MKILKLLSEPEWVYPEEVKEGDWVKNCVNSFNKVELIELTGNNNEEIYYFYCFNPPVFKQYSKEEYWWEEINSVRYDTKIQVKRGNMSIKTIFKRIGIAILGVLFAAFAIAFFMTVIKLLVWYGDLLW